MKALRRAVLFVLLLTVPFQTAIGATGYVCGHAVRHSSGITVNSDAAPYASAHRHSSGSHAHAASYSSVRHIHAGHASAYDAVDSGAMQAVLTNPQSADFNDAGTCEFCSECSFSLAPANESAPNAFRHASPLWVSFYVDPAALSHVGDALFRPPRSILS